MSLLRTGRPLTTFTELGVLPEITEALATKGIETAFPIQQMALPIALTGTDLIGQARTGTGKTFAFGIPLAQRCVAPHDPDFAELAAPGRPQALIIAPTRELAIQVAGDIELISSRRGTRFVTVYGGVPYEPQLEALENGVEIVIGTPGRLLDLANRRALDLSHVKSVVLDEADEMLDLGFLPDVEALLGRTPELRQTMLFSATMPAQIVTLARRHMRHPLNVRAESAAETQMVPATAQFVWQTHDLDKPEIVARILQAEDRGKVIVFTKTKRAAQRVADDLDDRGFSASPLHGDMAQTARERALTKFRDGKIDVLVATDVAARGIDVAGVSHVINYACPDDEKTYVHRIGRTGRAGATGSAITFVDWSDLTRWKVINKALDLPFTDPAEIYSTSPDLFQMIGIPTDAGGRVGDAKDRKPKSLSELGGPPRKGAGGRGQQGSRGGSGGRDRQGGGRGGSGPKRETTPSSPDESATQGAANPNRRRRRRRRTRNGSTVDGSQASKPADS